MVEMVELSSSWFNRALEASRNCDRQANCHEWSEKVYQATRLYATELLTVLEVHYTADTEVIIAAADAWRTANKRLYSALYFATIKLAYITVKAHRVKTIGFSGDGGAA